MSTNIKALEEFFEAVNRNDMQAIVKDFDPQIVRVEPEGFPTSGTYRGIDEVLTQFTRARGTWAEGICEPQKFLENGDKIVVYVQVHVRLKDAPDWIDGRIADGFVFCNGKITQHLTFAERVDALKWAGIEEQQAI